VPATGAGGVLAPPLEHRLAHAAHSVRARRSPRARTAAASRPCGATAEALGGSQRLTAWRKK
jgi:hypothetical protein